MKKIDLGKRRRNGSSLFLYRIEAGKNIYTGMKSDVLAYAERIYGGCKIPTDFIGRGYIPLSKHELAEFEEIFGLKQIPERKLGKRKPTKEHIYTDQEEWDKLIREAKEMLKRY